MYALKCPKCGVEVPVRFARVGAIATCIGCREVFTVDEDTLRSKDGSALPPTGTAPLASPPPPEAISEPCELNGHAPGASSAAIEVDAVTPHTDPREGEWYRFAVSFLILAGVALAGTFALGVFKKSESGQPDRDPPAIKALVETEPPTDPSPSIPTQDPADVRLAEGMAPGWPYDRSVPLSPVVSRIGLIDGPDGTQSLSLAVRNETGETLYNPLIVVEIIGPDDTPLRNWHAAVEATLAPGQLFEFEAHPPKPDDRTAGSIELRAVAFPAAGTP